MHDNANITFALNESFATLNALIRLQPKTSSASGRSSEDVGLIIFISLHYYIFQTNRPFKNLQIRFYKKFLNH